MTKLSAYLQPRIWETRSFVPNGSTPVTIIMFSLPRFVLLFSDDFWSAIKCIGLRPGGPTGWTAGHTVFVVHFYLLLRPPTFVCWLMLMLGRNHKWKTDTLHPLFTAVAQTILSSNCTHTHAHLHRPKHIPVFRSVLGWYRPLHYKLDLPVFDVGQNRNSCSEVLPL